MKATTEDTADTTALTTRILRLEGNVATLQAQVDRLMEEMHERGAFATAEHKEPKAKKHHNPP